VRAGGAGLPSGARAGGRRGGRMRKKYDPREFQRQLERRNAAARGEAAEFAKAAEAPALEAAPADAADKPRCVAGSRCSPNVLPMRPCPHRSGWAGMGSAVLTGLPSSDMARRHGLRAVPATALSAGRRPGAASGAKRATLSEPAAPRSAEANGANGAPAAAEAADGGDGAGGAVAAPALCWKPERVAADLELSGRLVLQLDQEKGVEGHPLAAPPAALPGAPHAPLRLLPSFLLISLSSLCSFLFFPRCVPVPSWLRSMYYRRTGALVQWLTGWATSHAVWLCTSATLREVRSPRPGRRPRSLHALHAASLRTAKSSLIATRFVERA